MLFKLIPESMVFLRVGSTLFDASVIQATCTEFLTPDGSSSCSLLRWVCRVNNDRILGLVVRDYVGIVVATTLPYIEKSQKLPVSKRYGRGHQGADARRPTHGDRFDMHLPCRSGLPGISNEADIKQACKAYCEESRYKGTSKDLLRCCEKAH